MGRRRIVALCACLVAALTAGPGAAQAQDPGLWAQREATPMPLEYFQGVTHQRGPRLFFAGVFKGLYATDADLRETTRNADAIPPAVAAAEGYNHIGDITYDRAQGGRVLLPLECYVPGRPNGGNTCGTGSFGVADPATLAWRYHVKLDPAEIAKAMWVEVSPNGRLLWTSSGRDLLAYRAADVTAANAAPGAPPIRAVRRLAGAVPPSGITGAVFIGRRLYVAGQGGGPFAVWSIDVRTGARQLEIERPFAGESEGLDFARNVLGHKRRSLYWMVMPFDPAGRPPTFGPGRGALVRFVRQR